MLIDAPIAASYLPLIGEKFRQTGIKIHGCQKTQQVIHIDKLATEEDFKTEYLDLICNIRVVPDIDAAIEHIRFYGSRHTDAIITNSYTISRKFIREVDSSSVMVNASTRLADGGVYGLGAEIGISTDKLHAFGPMGVEELTTKKFIVFGEGHLRE